MNTKKYHAIPTNIITGFLGAGKTTVIRHLLKTKPEKEKWAVLVNEFGEVGIDGAFLNGDGLKSDEIAVKEVPGGCMCCSVGLPSRTALNNLIRSHNPDRILIEPTGLAHPAQILDMFSGQEYQEVLELKAVVCLVDPWSISEPKFLELPAFRDQISLADILIATKQDVAVAEHLAAFRTFSEKLQPAKAAVETISNGNLPWQLLDLKRGAGVQSSVDHHPSHPHTHHHTADSPSTNLPKADHEGVIRVESRTAHQDQSVGCGWIFPSNWQFDRDQLIQFFEQLTVPRIKGVFATVEGWCAINKMRQNISSEVIEHSDQSRVEMINLEPIDWESIDQKLRNSRLNTTD